MEQRTAEWLMARVGHATASRFKDVCARLKNGQPAAARQTYLTELVCERLTGSPAARFVSAAMDWGTEQEPFARAAYQQRTGRMVDEVGFIRHPELMAGASPDGIVDLEGIIEIKCPTTPTHMDTLMNGMSRDHQFQVQGQLWITGHAWADFVSYDPRLPTGLDLHVERVERDESAISLIEAEVRAFLADVDSTITRLQERTR
jgi:predicted phage-related endonuclease